MGLGIEKEPFVRSAIPTLTLVFGLAMLFLTPLFFFVDACSKLSAVTSSPGQTYNEYFDCNRPRIRGSSVGFRPTKQASFRDKAAVVSFFFSRLEMCRTSICFVPSNVCAGGQMRGGGVLWAAAKLHVMLGTLRYGELEISRMVFSS